MTPFLTIIIPAFNEEQRIRPGLEAVAKFVAAETRPVELLVVNDGSTDRTVEVVQSVMREAGHFRLIQSDVNRGKGHAVRLGMLAARGDFILFMDADLSTHLDALTPFLKALEQSADVAIASRRSSSSVISRGQSPLRRFLGWGFRRLIGTTLLPGISDITCGFKVFRREAAHHLFALQMVHNWAFDVEILVLARQYGYRITEIPIKWSNADGTKVRIFRDVFGTLISLIQIRWAQLTGIYESRNQSRQADVLSRSSFNESEQSQQPRSDG